MTEGRIVSIPNTFRSARRIVPNAKRIRLEIGPAIATRKRPRNGFSKALISTGTGFAQPKRKISINIKPIGSRCFSGLRVSLPSIFAVGSPSLNAIQAWANSWKVSETIVSGIAVSIQRN